MSSEASIVYIREFQDSQDYIGGKTLSQKTEREREWRGGEST